MARPSAITTADRDFRDEGPSPVRRHRSQRESAYFPPTRQSITVARRFDRRAPWVSWFRSSGVAGAMLRWCCRRWRGLDASSSPADIPSAAEGTAARQLMQAASTLRPCLDCASTDCRQPFVELDQFVRGHILAIGVQEDQILLRHALHDFEEAGLLE